MGPQKRCLSWVLKLKYFSHSQSVLLVSLIFFYWLSSCDTDAFGKQKMIKKKYYLILAF